MPTFEELLTETERTDDFLFNMQQNHRQRVRRSIKKLEDRIVSASKRLSTTTSGRLEGAKVNLKQAQAVHRDMVKIFAEEYGVTTESIVGEFSEISNFIKGSYTNLDEAVRFTGVNRKMYDQLKSQSLTDYENLGLQAQQRIANAMYDQVAAGGSYSQLVNTFKGVLRGQKDVRGTPMETHAETHAFDSMMNFHNQVNLSEADELGIGDYLYVGDIIGTSRRFCITRAGKVYSRAQIESWNKLEWQGKRGPAFEFRGGWRCRHHWRPVRTEWLTEGEDGEFGEVTPDEMFASQQRRDFPTVDKAISQKEQLKKKHDTSQQKSKKLKAERAKIQKKSPPHPNERTLVKKINATLTIEKDLRRELKKEIAALKGDVAKHGKKIKADIKAGKVPKALTKKELHPSKPKVITTPDLHKSGIHSITDIGTTKHKHMSRDVVFPIQEETDRMAAFGNGTLKKRLAQPGKQIKIDVNSSRYLDVDAEEVLGTHTSGKSGGKIRLATNETGLTAKDIGIDEDFFLGEWQVNPESYRGVYRHEFGHHVHKELLSQGERRVWFDLYDERSVSSWITDVSDYASDNVREAFAESFSAYMHPKYRKGLLPADVEDFFDGLLKKGQTKAEIAKATKAAKPVGKSTGAFKNRSHKWGQDSWSGWHDNLTAKQLDAFESYVYDDEIYGSLNHHLRKGTTKKLSAYQKGIMQNIDDAMKKGFVQEDTFVYRGSGGTRVEWFKDNVGKTVTDEGFKSTSVAKNIATDYMEAEGGTDFMTGEFKEPMLAKIRLRKGSNAGYMSYSDIDIEAYDEKEVLLPRGTKMKILGVKRRKGGSKTWLKSYWEVLMEVV